MRTSYVFPREFTERRWQFLPQQRRTEGLAVGWNFNPNSVAQFVSRCPVENLLTYPTCWWAIPRSLVLSRETYTHPSHVSRFMCILVCSLCNGTTVIYIRHPFLVVYKSHRPIHIGSRFCCICLPCHKHTHSSSL